MYVYFFLLYILLKVTLRSSVQNREKKYEEKIVTIYGLHTFLLEKKKKSV